MSAFRKTGIVPLNPWIVLQNIPDTEPESPRILQDHEQTFSSPFHTPITLRKVEKLSDDIEERLEGIDEALVDDILALSRGTIANTTELVHVKRDLGRTKLADTLRKSQKQRKNQRLSYGGILTVEEGRKMARKKDGLDLEKAAKLVERARKKDEAIQRKASQESQYTVKRQRKNTQMDSIHSTIDSAAGFGVFSITGGSFQDE